MKRIGIIGGGQLGKMMALEAQKMNFHVITLDPAADCPASPVSNEAIVAGFGDEAALRALARKSDVLTYEFEHINAPFLLQLEREGHIIYPTPQSLINIQDKLAQKQILRGGGAPVPNFTGVGDIGQLERAAEDMGFPIMLKSRFGGYDGKGNMEIRSKSDIPAAFEKLSGPLMAESWVDFTMEVSVLACRAADGQVKVYPAAQNIHEGSILRKTIAPAPVSAEINKAAMGTAARVMEIFSGVGMFCVEMFVTKGGGPLVNEVAPRPHNSGHYTIEACVTSQFANHVRAVAGLPLGDTSQTLPAVMENILGAEGFSGPAVVEGAEGALSVPGVALHVYGKTETRPRRKMGHVTAVAGSIGEALERAGRAAGMVRVVSK